MRVLMLGWEFLRYISGGLGTACDGLTKALSHVGTDILFVAIAGDRRRARAPRAIAGKRTRVADDINEIVDGNEQHGAA